MIEFVAATKSEVVLKKKMKTLKYIFFIERFQTCDEWIVI